MIARARAAGVEVVLTIGTRLSTFASVRAITEAEESVYCSIGVHPHRADEEGLDRPDALLEHTGHPKVIAVGEAGLDYYYEHSSKAAQARNFEAHIEAARASGLPLVVHTRDADADTIGTLERAMAKGLFPGVIHCYSSSHELARAAIAMGLYLGIGGILTFKRSEALRQTVRNLPLDRLLLETDAPYLAPEPLRGKRNEPANISRIAAKLAEVMGVPLVQVAEATTDNFFRLFRKARQQRS